MKKNYLDYLIDPTYKALIDCLYFHSKMVIMILQEILFKNVKKKETNKKLLQMPGNDNYKTENLFDYLYHQNYCKRIGIDLKNQTNTNIPQQISYIGKLEEWCSNVFYC